MGAVEGLGTGAIEGAVAGLAGAGVMTGGALPPGAGTDGFCRGAGGSGALATTACGALANGGGAVGGPATEAADEGTVAEWFTVECTSCPLASTPGS